VVKRKPGEPAQSRKARRNTPRHDGNRRSGAWNSWGTRAVAVYPRPVKRAVALVTLISHVAVALVTATHASPAHAQPAEPAAAPGAAPPAGDAAARSQTLKAEGDKAIGEMRYTDAFSAYSRAYEANPTWEVRFNRGRAAQFLGKYPEALADFEAFAKEAPADVRGRVPGIDKIIADVRKQVAFVTIRCPIDGATVVLGDRVLGTTPLPKRIGVNAGEGDIKVTAPNRESYVRHLVLTGGGTEIQVDVVLAAVGDGLLRIESGTPGAIAFVDEARAGAVPVEVAVKPGAHEVVLSAEGYVDGSQSAVSTAGTTKLVRFDLVEETPVYATWWFWTGVGLVVAGGVATAIIVTQEKDPPSGNFSPGQVSVQNARPLFSF
jgi:hypothetical protein